MAAVGVGLILLYVLLAVVGFVVAVAVLRWAFGINKIVGLLEDISNSLKLRKAPAVASATTATPSRGEPIPPRFGVAAYDLSVGDWIVDASGQRLEVVGFKGKDLEVKLEGGDPFRISPPFNSRKA